MNTNKKSKNENDTESHLILQSVEGPYKKPFLERVKNTFNKILSPKSEDSLEEFNRIEGHKYKKPSRYFDRWDLGA